MSGSRSGRRLLALLAIVPEGVLAAGRGRPRRWAVVEAGYFLALAALVLGPLLGPGYVLTLDMVFSPNTDYVGFLLRTKGPLYYGRLPLLVVFDVVTAVVPDWVVQQAGLVGIVTGSGLAAARAVPGDSRAGRLYAGTVYAVNPFVYVRLLAGHWYLMLGYAVMPLAVVAVSRWLVRADSGRRRLGAAAGLATLVAVFDPHSAVLLAIVAGCIGGVSVARADRPERRRLLRRGGTLAAVTAGLNAYWLLPAVRALAGGGTKITAMTGADLAVFGARGTLQGNVPLSVAALWGFWRTGYRTTVATVPEPLVLALLFGVLLLTVAGLFANQGDSLTVGVGVAAVLGLLLGVGVGHPVTEPVVRWLFAHVPVARSMRDTQKFAALVALAYAVLGGYGVRAVQRGLRDRGRAASPRRNLLEERGGVRATAIAVCLTVLLLSGPLVYALPMLGGLGGQVERTTYPDDWERANDRLRADDGRYRVLVLPWHQYVRFGWTDRTVANPTDVYFDRPVLRGRNIELAGIESQATAPTHRRVRALLAAPERRDRFGPAVADLGVKYVLLLEEADYRTYDFLEDGGLTTLVDGETVRLYRNPAFDDAPPPAAWPPASPPVPVVALAVGGLCTLGTVGALAAGGRTLGRVRRRLTGESGRRQAD